LKDWFESKLEEVRSSLTEKIVEQAAEIAKLKKRKSVVCWSGFGKMSRGAKLSSKRRRMAETINLESPPAKKGKFSRDGEPLSEAEDEVVEAEANAGIVDETRAKENVCRALDMTVEVDGGSEGECLEENCDVDNTGEENEINLGDDEEEYDPELCSITPGGSRQRADPVEIELILVKKFSLKKKRDGTDLLPPLDRAEFAFFAATLKACPHM
ncbi:hypothetical protein AALP_AAs44981U000100, partial [Arabis alpina]